MGQPQINVDDVIAAVDRAIGEQASATEFIERSFDVQAEAVRAALEKDDKVDQEVIDSVLAAMTAKKDELIGSTDRLAVALRSNPTTPTEPTEPTTVDPLEARRERAGHPK
jgi:cell division FtsZ-interacting protein ZapD